MVSTLASAAMLTRIRLPLPDFAMVATKASAAAAIDNVNKIAHTQISFPRLGRARSVRGAAGLIEDELARLRRACPLAARGGLLTPLFKASCSVGCRASSARVLLPRRYRSASARL